MNLAEQIQQEFPDGVSLPNKLRDLCGAVEQFGYPVSGLMEIRPAGESLFWWFSKKREASDQLAGFGGGPDGSILALWLYQGPDASIAPVVHLGSEGDNLFILANTFDEFLPLLGIGYEELGYDDLSAVPEEPESALRLREWLEKQFSLSCPELGQPILDAAKVNHPDFEAWVGNWWK